METILVTGGAGGLGLAISEEFAISNDNLILIDLDEIKLKEIKKTFESKYLCKVDIFAGDLESASYRSNVLETITRNYRNLNTLINNVAFVGTSELSGWIGSLENQTIDTWRRALELNLTCAFDFSKNLFPLLLKSNNASIINISSIYGHCAPDFSLYEGLSGMGNPAAYGASKAGINYLTKYLASAMAPKVRVNAVSPGGVRAYQDPEFIDRYSRKVLLKRMAEYSDIVPLVKFLASRESGYITGQNIFVDGGFNIC
jgi:NAD(P)-dependent dehydrogenase (short-subunit alcohol dehydrogenase family)